MATGKPAGAEGRVPYSDAIVMPPEGIDYRHIDPAVKALVRKINALDWIRTLGCCGGRASHHDRNMCFYLVVEVGGHRGVVLLSAWLSMARVFSLASARRGFRIVPTPEATLSNPDLLEHGAITSTDSVTGSHLGDDWVRYHIGLRNDPHPWINKPVIQNAIAALGRGIDILAALPESLVPSGAGVRAMIGDEEWAKARRTMDRIASRLAKARRKAWPEGYGEDS